MRNLIDVCETCNSWSIEKGAIGDAYTDCAPPERSWKPDYQKMLEIRTEECYKIMFEMRTKELEKLEKMEKKVENDSSEDDDKT